MAMNMTEKILARASGRESVKPGELILARVDFAMGHDLTIPPASKIMREQMGATKVWDPERLAVVQEHFQPAKDTAPAALGKPPRDWARPPAAGELWAQGFRPYFLRGALWAPHAVPGNQPSDGQHGARTCTLPANTGAVVWARAAAGTGPDPVGPADWLCRYRARWLASDLAGNGRTG